MPEFIMELGDALYDEKTGEAVFKPKIVSRLCRCKDCVAYGEMFPGKDTRMICHKFALNFPRDFFCADGERKTE